MPRVDGSDRVCGSCSHSLWSLPVPIHTGCPRFAPFPRSSIRPHRGAWAKRVASSFHLDAHRRPVQVTIRESSESVRLDEGASRVVKGLRFDPSDHRKADPQHTYRLTIAFCLDSLENCKKRFFPLDDFDDSQDIMVRSTRVRINVNVPDSASSF